MKILIIGASGGIGAAILKHCQQRYPNAELHATYFTTPPPASNEMNPTWHQFDASCEADIKNLSQHFAQLDWVINCVGFLHNEEQGPEKNLNSVDANFFYHNISRNTLPTLLLAKHFSAPLKKSAAPKFASLSAKVGSISDNRLGGWYSYRASKAALNMLIKTISIEWHRTLRKGVILALHPGTTDTALSKPFQTNVPTGKLFTPGNVAQDLLAIIERSTPDDSGLFYSYSGEALPW
ncbi:SDR family oxidoreductase [Vibrio sp. JPW-9-11-11]|uniref:SDR family oxidoreductase n=1 Tax=Vibrio sp. JPW-9-11-11 TaxID=1416532 RepID=UPI0015932190|nr:SDR family oxidoreductase [Vibrio sp. JPW-9-11-11]NVD07711.1 SDR family oxidoreductase [Vibrio sp. JPW-9-11-11]